MLLIAGYSDSKDQSVKEIEAVADSLRKCLTYIQELCILENPQEAYHHLRNGSGQGKQWDIVHFSGGAIRRMAQNGAIWYPNRQSEKDGKGLSLYSVQNLWKTPASSPALVYLNLEASAKPFLEDESIFRSALGMLNYTCVPFVVGNRWSHNEERRGQAALSFYHELFSNPKGSLDGLSLVQKARRKAQDTSNTSDAKSISSSSDPILFAKRGDLNVYKEASEEIKKLDDSMLKYERKLRRFVRSNGEELGANDSEKLEEYKNEIMKLKAKRLSAIDQYLGLLPMAEILESLCSERSRS